MARKTAKTAWGSLSRERKKEAVREAWVERALSDEDIAEERGATKGQIVGFRHRHLPELTGKDRTELTMSTASPAKNARLKKAPASAAKRPQGLLADPPSRPKLTTNDALMCTHVDPDDKKRCPYHYEDPDTKRCRLHPL